MTSFFLILIYTYIDKIKDNRKRKCLDMSISLLRLGCKSSLGFHLLLQNLVQEGRLACEFPNPEHSEVVQHGAALTVGSRDGQRPGME